MSSISPGKCLLLLLLIGAAPTVQAGRTLKEPKALAALRREPAGPARQQALEARGVADRCDADVFRSPEASGVLCRLALLAERAAAKPLTSTGAIDARMRAAADALSTAETLAAYQPLTRQPGLPQQLFAGHRLACQVAMEALDAVRGLPPTVPAALRAHADKALAATPKTSQEGLHDAACRCTQQSLELGSTAGAPLEELGALQQALTGHSCFLDQNKLKSERGGPATQFDGEAKSMAEEASTEGKLLAYAKTRDLGLERCRAKNISSGLIKDGARLKQCVCGDIRRWSFPKERGRPVAGIVVPIVEDLVAVEVKVKANGKVSDCGPLVGKGVR